MHFAELVRARRTIHSFSNEPIDRALVNEALSLAAWAPNHKQTWPIRLIEIGPHARERVIEVALDLKSDSSEIKRQALAKALREPPVLIALALERAEKEKTARENYATLAAGVQNMCLSLWAAGVGTKWSTAGWSTDPRTFAILGLDPRRVNLEGCLLIGRARATPPAPSRPSLAQTLRVVD